MPKEMAILCYRGQKKHFPLKTATLNNTGDAEDDCKERQKSITV